MATSEFINPNRKQHLSIEFVNGAAGKVNDEDLVFAEFLAKLKWFHDLLKQARINIGINEKGAFSSGASNSDILSLSNQLNPDQLRDLMSEAHLLGDKLGLRAWDLTLWSAILSNKLVLYPSNSKVVLHLPQTTMQSSQDPLNQLLQPGRVKSKALVIEVNEKITRNQLHKFIDEQRKVIDSALKELPGVRPTKIEDRVIILGEICWLIKQSLPAATWPEILSELEFIKQELKLPKLPHVGDDLRKIYEDYLKYSSRI